MSGVRWNKETSATTATGGGAAKIITIHSSKTTRSTTPVSDRSNISAGKENINSSRSTSRIQAAVKPQKPLVPPIIKQDRFEPRARWSTSVPRGRSSSPSEFNRVTSDVRKTRVSRVSSDRNDKIERNERSVSVGRSTRISDKASQQKKGDNNCKPSSYNGSVNLKTKVVNLEKKSELCEELKKKNVMTQNAGLKTKVMSLEKKSEVCEQSKNKSITTQNASLKTECGSDSVMMKVSESVKLFEKFKSKSCVGLRLGNGIENEEKGARLSFGGSSGKVSSRGSSLDGLNEKGGGEDGLSGRLSGKYPSKLHGKLAFLEEKVKRIASDIKRTKEMLDLNNPDASKVMLSDMQDTVAGIEKAMGDVVSGEKENKCLTNVNEKDNVEITVLKKSSPTKELSGTKSSAKGLNTDELEARLFPHHKLLRDRSTLKATSGNKDILKTEVALVIAETKIEFSDSSSKNESKVTTRGGGLEICEVEETDSKVSSKSHDNPNTCNVKGDVETTLTTDETLDEQENKTFTVFEVEMDDSFNNQLNEIGHKTSTGGWFVSEGESVLLAHDDSSCTFYDVANCEEKSIYKAPSEVSPNLWRDCWILRAPGADGCAGRYVVAASAGNSMDSGFCSWDFYTKEVKSFHIEDGVANTRTALAPLPNNVLNRRHDLANLTPENRQWWYKPSGPLIVSTASNQKVVSIYDIRDGEHIMKWEVQNCVSAMENTSPLQWSNRGKVVVAEAEILSLWDVGSLTPEPLLSVSSSGKQISALHINNTDAELGGGVRQRVNSAEAEGNDGIFCTSDSINILDFRHPSGIGLKIPKYGTTAHSVFSKGDSIYLGCSGSPSSTRKPTSASQIQQFSIRKQKLFSTYTLPESNAHPHYKAITQVWGDSNLTMGVCGLGLFVFDAFKDDGSKPFTSDYGSGQKIRETVGPDNLYCPSFDYLGSRALLISRDRPAFWKYLS